MVFFTFTTLLQSTFSSFLPLTVILDLSLFSLVFVLSWYCSGLSQFSLTEITWVLQYPLLLEHSACHNNSTEVWWRNHLSIVLALHARVVRLTASPTRESGKIVEIRGRDTVQITKSHYFPARLHRIIIPRFSLQCNITARSPSVSIFPTNSFIMY